MALTEILGKYPVTLEAFPCSIMNAAQAASAELMAELGGTSSLASRIVESYTTALQNLRGWSALAADMARANTRAHLPAR